MRTWEDISLQLYGTEKYAYELALNNDYSITDQPVDEDGKPLDIADIKGLDNVDNVKSVTSLYRDQAIEVATGLSNLDKKLLPAKEGIGYMVIEGEPVFKVS